MKHFIFYGLAALSSLMIVIPAILNYNKESDINLLACSIVGVLIGLIQTYRTYEESKSNEALTKDTHKAIMGGDSYCCFSIAQNLRNNVELYLLHKAATNSRSYPLHGVKAAISLCFKDYKISENSFYSNLILNSDGASGLPEEPPIIMHHALYDVKSEFAGQITTINDVDLNIHNILIKFTALNGEWTELFEVGFVNGQKNQRYLVYRNQKGKPVEIFNGEEL